MTDQPSTDFALGRIEGKVDTLLLLNSSLGARIDKLETSSASASSDRNDLSERIIALEVTSGTSRTWLSYLATGVALVFSLINLLKDHFHV